MKSCTLQELFEVHAFMDNVGLPKNKGYEDYVFEWIQKGMSVSDALTQTCDGWKNPCPSRIVHRAAKWRFRVTAIRCVECQKKAMAEGHDAWEARYVV